MRKKIYVDGEGTNSVYSRTCVIIDGKQPQVKKHSKDVPNNTAEYIDLHDALYFADKDTTIITDSQLLVGHLTESGKLRLRT